jgi:hypothetical protein
VPETTYFGDANDRQMDDLRGFAFFTSMCAGPIDIDIEPSPSCAIDTAMTTMVVRLIGIHGNDLAPAEINRCVLS